MICVGPSVARASLLIAGLALAAPAPAAAQMRAERLDWGNLDLIVYPDSQRGVLVWGAEREQPGLKRPVREFIAFFDPDSLDPVDWATRGTQLGLAVYVGRTRLIDNARL